MSSFDSCLRYTTTIAVLLSAVLAQDFHLRTFSSVLAFSSGPAFRSLYSRQRCNGAATERLHTPWTTTICASPRDDEIARLEDEIRRLREEGEQSSIESTASSSTGTQTAESLKDLEDKKRLLAEVKGKDMLLTEGALIQENLLEQDSSTNGLLPAILGAIFAVAVLTFFSQVPIGQDDLSRYSAPTGPTVSTKIDLGDINPDRPSGM